MEKKDVNIVQHQSTYRHRCIFQYVMYSEKNAVPEFLSYIYDDILRHIKHGFLTLIVCTYYSMKNTPKRTRFHLTCSNYLPHMKNS